MQIGDRVRVTRTLQRWVQENGAGDIRRVLLFDDVEIEGIFLGWTVRYTGIIGRGTSMETRTQRNRNTRSRT